MSVTVKKAPIDAPLTEKQSIRNLEKTLQLMRDSLVAALPVHIPVRSFISTVLTACAVEPKLLTCDRHSLFLSCLRAARDGLLPDGREAALVPFWDTKRRVQMVVYIPMYAGLLKKVRNSGELASLSANVVYANDVFEYELGDNERIVHKPAVGKERGPMVAAYAIAKTKDGGIYRRVLTSEEVIEIKNFSKAKDSGPWSGKFESEMWIKSAIRRLSKILPQSTDLNHYLTNGPPLPAAEASAVLPDAIGEEGFESVEFTLRARAMTAISDESPDADTLRGIWEGIKAEYHKLDIEVPVEVDYTYQMRKEALQRVRQ